MEIVGRTLTTCQVDPAGHSVRLGFESVDGQTASVVLPVDCLRSLLMTLPGVIERALRARYRDDTLKVVYPMGGWSLEAAAGSDGMILTMITADGFKVSFTLSAGEPDGLATSLAEADMAERRPVFN